MVHGKKIKRPWKIAQEIVLIKVNNNNNNTSLLLLVH